MCHLFIAQTATYSLNMTARPNPVYLKESFLLILFLCLKNYGGATVPGKGIDDTNKEIVTQDYYTDSSGKIPRYYQLVAINRTIEAIARGQDRILLVMATGTGKTFTAFQIIWRLWKSRMKKRILYLADRNILIDQTKTNADKSYEIYLSLYQAVSGQEEWKNIYKQFSPDFFDLVIIL
ncbi:hypothetical protein METP3_01035 [Methanosarcinales archaeon]|nr:hypothetical protein METP3_01035 [Methanosarcinales archaeon]